MVQPRCRGPRVSGRGHSLGLFPLQCQFALELMIFQGSCIGLFFQENATTKDTAQIYKPGIFRNYVSFQSGLVNIGLIIMVFLIIMQVVASITSGFVSSVSVVSFVFVDLVALCSVCHQRPCERTVQDMRTAKQWAWSLIPETQARVRDS